MGSRSDMISMKIDEVSRNYIWREHLVKEAKREGPLMGFQFNPATVSSVTVKPTSVDPRDYTRPSAVLSPEGKMIEAKILSSEKMPQEKYEFPMTRSQEIGWLNSEAWTNGRDRLSATWYSGKGTTDVTRFADAYCTMAGCSPFADKNTR